MSYKQGNKDGKHTGYYENGQINGISYYSNNVLNGDYVVYYSNGKNKTTGYYDNGEPRRTWIYYDEDGDYRKYQYTIYRVGAICNDGWRSSATGQGACSWHGGVRYWLTETKRVFVSGTGKYKNNNQNQFRYY